MGESTSDVVSPVHAGYRNRDRSVFYTGYADWGLWRAGGRVGVRASVRPCVCASVRPCVCACAHALIRACLRAWKGYGQWVDGLACMRASFGASRVPRCHGIRAPGPRAVGGQLIGRAGCGSRHCDTAHCGMDAVPQWLLRMAPDTHNAADSPPAICAHDHRPPRLRLAAAAKTQRQAHITVCDSPFLGDRPRLLSDGADF